MNSTSPTPRNRRGPAFPKLPQTLRTAAQTLAEMETVGPEGVDEELAAKRAAQQAREDALAARQAKAEREQAEARRKAQAQQAYNAERSAYLAAARKQLEEEELPKVQAAVREYVIKAQAFEAPYRPKDPMWWARTFLDMAVTEQRQVQALKSALETYLRG